jgi:CRP-like cAMP-binding protein
MEEEGGTEATFNVIVTSEELLAFRLLKSDYQHIIIDLMVVNR